MTVAELKELLDEYKDTDLVIIQKDAEGNSHSPLAGAWDGSYEATSTWSGEVGLRKLDAEAIGQGYEADDVLENGKDACILYPVN